MLAKAAPKSSFSKPTKCARPPTKTEAANTKGKSVSPYPKHDLAGKPHGIKVRQVIVPTPLLDGAFWHDTPLGQSWQALQLGAQLELHVLQHAAGEAAGAHCNHYLQSPDLSEFILFVRAEAQMLNAQWLLLLEQALAQTEPRFDVLALACHDNHTATGGAGALARRLAPLGLEITQPPQATQELQPEQPQEPLQEPPQEESTAHDESPIAPIAMLLIRRSAVLQSSLRFDPQLEWDAALVDFYLAAQQLPQLSVSACVAASLHLDSPPATPTLAWRLSQANFRLRWSHYYPVTREDVVALIDQGNAHFHANAAQQAVPYYLRALELAPDVPEIHFNLATAYQAQYLYHLALPCYERGVELSPDPRNYLALLISNKMQVCDWKQLDEWVGKIEALVLAGQQVCSPFQIISVSSNPAVHRQAAQLWIQALPNPSVSAFSAPVKAAHEKLRIGYFSADLQTHPVAYLTAEMFELHDHAQFDVIAFSNGHGDESDSYRQRIASACQQFIDIREMHDEQVIELARQLALDIAIDLTGLTKNARPGIFMARVAPVQMHYLGYPATSSIPNMDYIIADSVVIPPSMRQHYSEQVLSLPHCFQVSDRRRPIANPPPTRAALGIADDAFIFCCFCSEYKITPDGFNAWMRILQAVPHGVLMLYANSELTQQHLRQEAASRGVDPSRLHFGCRVGLSDYLARYTVCDLFLDTMPYNAGTTANDVLWMGLPLLTVTGELMIGRMAASLLYALGLDELVTANWDDYAARAIELATQPARYAAIKTQLIERRSTYPLFDTPRTVKALERGFIMAINRHRQGLAPEHLSVASSELNP